MDAPRPVVWLAIALVALALGVWWWTRRPTHPAVSEDDRLDTVGGWPPQVTRLLTPAERTAFSTLCQALPDYTVFSQVPLARFIEVSKRNSYAEWLRRVGHQSIDFLICDANSQVVAAVDLQAPPAQATARALKRQARMARTLKAARVPLHVWAIQSLPSPELARDSILGLPAEPLPGPSPRADGRFLTDSGLPTETAPSGSVSAPVGPVPAVKGRNPFDDTGRDSSQDEFIEAPEPPATTWYDDLDSGPTPLTPLTPQKQPRR